MGFGHWNTEYSEMRCLSDNQTMAFEDQSTIPKATCIEIGVYHVVMRLLSRHSKTPPSSAPVLFHFSLSMADKL